MTVQSGAFYNGFTHESTYGEYDPSNTAYQTSGSQQSIFGFTGEPRDGNNLVYLRARYLNPTLGSFVSRDPYKGCMSRAMSINGYSYVEGNVINATDPSGMRGLFYNANGDVTPQFIRPAYAAPSYSRPATPPSNSTQVTISVVQAVANSLFVPTPSRSFSFAPIYVQPQPKSVASFRFISSRLSTEFQYDIGNFMAKMSGFGFSNGSRIILSQVICILGAVATGVETLGIGAAVSCALDAAIEIGLPELLWTLVAATTPHAPTIPGTSTPPSTASLHKKGERVAWAKGYQETKQLTLECESCKFNGVVDPRFCNINVQPDHGCPGDHIHVYKFHQDASCFCRIDYVKDNPQTGESSVICLNSKYRGPSGTLQYPSYLSNLTNPELSICTGGWTQT